MELTTGQKKSARVVTLTERTPAPPSPAAQAVTPPSAYYSHILGYAHKIRQTHDAAEIIRILDEALQETRKLHAPDELAVARKQVASAERRISALKAELEEVSGLLREDPLTGALNRRGLEETYAREAARCDRRGVALCLVLLDLDDFKTLNDTHGHQAGDAALVELTHTARSTLRPNDSIARIGGEEFVLLLPDTELDSAVAVTSRLATTLAVTDLLHCGPVIRVSFSGGIALRNPAESLHAMLSRADEALYCAKHSGKNRTEIASQ
jgi:diguanylate cyclase (GGDEF)-like protein